MHYKTIFISDVHLGSTNSQAKVLLDFLKHNSCEKLLMVGDIIDGWKVVQGKWRWKKSHTAVANYILKLSLLGTTKVHYISGNHDEFLRHLRGGIEIGSISISHKQLHIGTDGKRYLVIHGDAFDGAMRIAKWASYLGDSAYDFVLALNARVNTIRRVLGLDYWSLSKYLKNKVKKAVNYIFEFEGLLARYCYRKGYDGVICGHIHQPDIKNIAGIKYMNCGDWVDNCSALVENFDGSFGIIYWTQHDKTNDSD